MGPRDGRKLSSPQAAPEEEALIPEIAPAEESEEPEELQEDSPSEPTVSESPELFPADLETRRTPERPEPADHEPSEQHSGPTVGTAAGGDQALIPEGLADDKPRAAKPKPDSSVSASAEPEPQAATEDTVPPAGDPIEAALLEELEQHQADRKRRETVGELLSCDPPDNRRLGTEGAVSNPTPDHPSAHQTK